MQISMKLQEIAEEFYLDYFNNFLTVKGIADHYDISKELALALIKYGKVLNNEPKETGKL